MRVLYVSTLVTVLSIAVTAVDSADSIKADVTTVQSNVELLSRVLAINHKQVKRSLRRYIPGELDSADEEDRGALDKVDDIVTKLDDVAGKQKKLTPKWDALVKKNLEQLSTTGALAKKLSGKYEDAYKLSMSTLKQLDEIEKLRVNDIATYSKETGKSMRRTIEPFDGIKIAPKKFLESHVGRENQLYGKDGSRLLACGVVYRPETNEILLVSSSNPKKYQYLLMKGGWDNGEDVKRAALREVMEEGGVKAELMHGLGKTKFSEGDKKYAYYSYLMKANTVYDDWAESARYRVWASYDDAIVLLADRPHMVKVVKQAKKIAEKVKAGELPEKDRKMRKFTLDFD
ncbi:Secreted RxLR effector peptide protein [Phytophthora palmivora]|uniref:Secreted RxLR effector peptide protein n=1 Tax=Phytophthora palmivora TaxID=4796 RepID=A0A2P4XT95_9STRA|nr:Secreted RxLR effector peptide protein [Phytophthora palmivora]